MKILFYQDPPNTNSTQLIWTLGEELVLRGHDVHFGTPDMQIAERQHYDWVRCGGERSHEAVDLAREIGAKVHVHLEGLGHWRVGAETADSWGFAGAPTEDDIESWKERYRGWMSAAFEADSCSVNGTRQVEIIEDYLFNGKKLPNCHKVACGADARFALSLPGYKRDNLVVTVSRLSPNKRVQLVAKALALCKNKYFSNNPDGFPDWVIIGYGTDQQVENIISTIQEARINLRMLTRFGAAKWVYLKKARLMLQGVSGIPPAEGLLCDTPVLSFDYPSIVEKFGYAIFWAANNNVEDYADQIKWMLDHPVEIRQKTALGKSNLLNGRLFATTQELLAREHERIFQKY